MSFESTNFNNDEILLPPKNTKKKTLVLDLDETLVHSQFMEFSDKSDLVIQIEIENEIHDIHVKVRPGVKEFLEKMDKIYELVVFTASISKYADPLLDLIDKKGYCPYRLFREHCTLINTTFVKDLQRLGRDIKNIIIVDNSPVSYALHPENGLRILTWFEDKSDRELYKITPILQFLSSVPDVREYIPKFVENNTINYDKANEIIRSNKGNKYGIKENRYSNCSSKSNYKNIGKGINIQTSSNNYNLNNNNNQNKENNIIYSTTNKDNNGGHQSKLVELAMKNIITSVSREAVADVPLNNNNNINSLIRSQRNSKNKIVLNEQKKPKLQEIKNNKEKKYVKIDTKNRIINVKNVTTNNNRQSPKKSIKSVRQSVTDDLRKFDKQNGKYSIKSNHSKNGVSNLTTNKEKSIILSNSINNNYLNFIKSKNVTPKINKTINLLNRSNHITRSVKYSKKTNTYIVNSTQNIIQNKMSKSLTKNTFNTKGFKINKDNKNNKNAKNNSIYKTHSTNVNNYIGLPNHKKQKSYNDFRAFEIRKFQIKNTPERNDKHIKQIELKKSKIFSKQGANQYKYTHNKINNINTNSSNNIILSNRFNTSNKINMTDYIGTNSSNNSNNKIRPTRTSNNLLNSPHNHNNHNRNNNKKSLDLNSNINQTQYFKIRNDYKNKRDRINDSYKNKINQRTMFNDNYETSTTSLNNDSKSGRPKSTNNNKFEKRINSKAYDRNDRRKYLNNNKSDISAIFKKKEIYRKKL